MQPSTKRIFRMHGWRVDRAIHNYIYFVFYDRYVALTLKTGRWMIKHLVRLPLMRVVFKAAYRRYHAKVITVPDVQKILHLRDDFIADPAVATQIIPFPYANKILLSEPQFIAVMDCPCRLSRENPCLPTRVCLAVGRTTAEFWLDHGKKYSVEKINADQALQIIRDARDRGCITTAWFKVATGGRTGVICSCCSCCCGGIEGMRLAKHLPGAGHISNIIPSGYVVEADNDLCRACGTCANRCFFAGTVFVEGQGRVYDREACMGCGLCVEKCPQGALSLHWDRGKGMPLDLDLCCQAPLDIEETKQS
jgi:ferredoxin